MEKLRKSIALTLLFTLAMTSLQGQSTYNEVDNAYSPAYMESNYTAHWSAYVPIGVMIAAAIWFGIADRKHDDTSSSSGSHSSSSRSGYSHSSRSTYYNSSTTSTYSHH
jgi:hypothetical protein